VRIGSGVGLNSRGEPRAAGPLLLIFMNVMLLVESGSGRFRCSALVYVHGDGLVSAGGCTPVTIKVGVYIFLLRG
jgi:hypothetical protein